MELQRLEEKKRAQAAKHETHLKFLLCQIEELNFRLADLRLAKDFVDVEELDQRMFAAREEEEMPEDMDEADPTFQTKATPLGGNRRRVYK